MDIRFINATVVTMDSKDTILQNSEVFVRGNKIEYVGKQREKVEGEYRTIDAKGNILLPGFINTHCHSAMSLFRGIGENSTFRNWWLDFMRPLEINLTPEDVYNGTILAICEMLKNGITTFVDLYFYVPEIAKAVLETGIRSFLCIGSTIGEETISHQFLEEKYNEISDIHSRIKPIVASHSVYSCDEDQHIELALFAKKKNLVFTTHASETLEEVGTCFKETGKTPIALLESYGMFDNKCILAHCVHCDKDDIEIMKQYDLCVSTNPSSNLYLASGIAPITSYVNNDILVSIGTDGPASNNSLDMFKEMFLVKNLQSGILNEADGFNAMQTLKMATTNGAIALDMKDLGSIQKGFLADIIMIDVHTSNMQPLNNIANSLVNSASSQNVLLTMVDGNVVYENGKYFFEKKLEEIIDNANKSISKLKSLVK